MSKQELDLLEAVTRAIHTAQTNESSRAACPTHGKIVRP